MQKGNIIIKTYKNEIIVSVLSCFLFAVISLLVRNFGGLSVAENNIISVIFTFVNCNIILATFLWRKIGLILDTLRFSEAGPIQNRVAECLLRQKEQKLLKIRERLNRYANLALGKIDMYRELTELTEVMDPKSGDIIMAVSSLNIEDWESPHAQVYLEANEEAVQKGVPVMRLFLLEKDDILGVNRGRYLKVVKRNYNALRPPPNAKPNVLQSDVKWILKEHVGKDEQYLDIAIFAQMVLMRQRASGEYELVIDSSEIEKVIPKFQNLWSRKNARSFEDLEKIVISGVIK